MKQELEAILSFGAQAVSGAKTVFDEAASRSLDRLIQGNSGYKEISSNPAELTQTLREATMQNGQSPLAVVVCCSDSRVPPEHILPRRHRGAVRHPQRRQPHQPIRSGQRGVRRGTIWGPPWSS